MFPAHYGRFPGRTWAPSGPSDVVPSDPSAFAFLAEATLGESRLLPNVSNYSLLVELCLGDRRGYGVYKPQAGEAPLWDFPSGTLYRREYAACLMGRLLGWELVPLTVVREGAYGVGSLQLYVPPVRESNYFAIREARQEEVLRMALFDVVTNNADRKASHCFEAQSGGVWGVDHGLTFHAQPKLRTVIWEFAERPIPEPLLEELRLLLGELEAATSDAVREFGGLLAPEEMRALRGRIVDVLQTPFFPSPYSRRDLPWPLL